MITNNNNDKITLLDKIRMGIVVLVGTVFVAFAVYGNVKLRMDKAECTEELTVGYTHDSMTERLMAPWHGGMVYTLYTHYREYTWSVNGMSHRVVLKYDSRSDKVQLPTMIRVTYDPNDSSHYWVWKISDDEDWRWYRYEVYDSRGNIGTRH